MYLYHIIVSCAAGGWQLPHPVSNRTLGYPNWAGKFSKLDFKKKKTYKLTEVTKISYKEGR